MAITIVVSCYKSVKVYPLDQRVPSNTYCTAVENLPTTPPLFVPFCPYQKVVAKATPPSTPPTVATTQPVTFTAAEVWRFQAHLQESENSSQVCIVAADILFKAECYTRTGDNGSISETPNTASTAKGM